MKNVYGYEIEDNKKELEKILEVATIKYGKKLPILNDVRVVSVQDLVNNNYFQFFVGDEQEDLTVTHVYTIVNTSVWYGYLTGLLLEWYTDEDFESGLFEDVDMTGDEVNKTISQLEALNEFMEDYEDRNWDVVASHQRIEQLENILDKIWQMSLIVLL